jgi:hypothetical protein
MTIRESSIERKAMCWAEVQGAITLKIEAKKGWPDRIVIKPNGVVMFVEFKAPGRKPNPLQAYVLQMLRQQRVKAYWVSSLKEFKFIYEKEY